MPNPFHNFPMSDLQNTSAEDFKRKVQESYKEAGPVQLNHAGKIAELAHFLVNNYKDDLRPGEHVVDTAIRIMERHIITR
jgi:UV DNA damage repair endonuclease